MLSTKHINDATAATALLDIQHCQSEKKTGKCNDVTKVCLVGRQ